MEGRDVSGYEVVISSGFTFFFRYDQVDPTILHIYARHLTSIDDALEVFFTSKPIRNRQFRRYENYSKTHGLYWFWRRRSKREIIIITCFRI